MSGRDEDFSPGSAADSATWSPIHSHEWYAARDAVAGLRDVLIAAGLDHEFPYLRADLNAFGMGLIELGRVSPGTAARLAELLNLALACGRDHQDTDDQGEETTP